MTVSKRMRYEVLRRDGHRCRYCGAAAPGVMLTVDHVVPVALGGSDDPSNLIAACGPCNAGKSSSSPDAPIVAAVDDKAARWANAMAQVAAERAADREWMNTILSDFTRLWEIAGWVDEEFNFYYYERDDDWGNSIRQLVTAGLNFDDLVELVNVSFENELVTKKWKYFCGCCWTRIRQNQDRAAEIVAQDVC